MRSEVGIAGNCAAFIAPVVLIGSFVALGGNSYVLGTAASVAAFGTAAIIIMLLPPATGFWKRLSPILIPFMLALCWAAVPFVAPSGATWRGWLAPGAFNASWIALTGILIWLPIGAMMGTRSGLTDQTIDIMAVLVVPWILFSLIAFKADPGSIWGIEKGLASSRFSATVLNPNTAGCAMAMISVLLASRFITEARAALLSTSAKRYSSVIRLISAWLILILVLGAMGLTGSRLAMMLGSIGITLIALQAHRMAHENRPYYFACVSALLLPLIGGIMVGGMRLAQKTASVAGDAAIRIRDHEHYWQLSLEAPWFGRGLGSFRALNTATLDPVDALHRWNFGAAHNVLLHGALEAGWPFVLLIAIGVAGGATILFSARATTVFDSMMYGLILAVGVAVIFGLFDIALNVPALAATATWLGGLAIGRAMRAQEARSDFHRPSAATSMRKEQTKASRVRLQ
jgi:hypothetical protein